MKHKCDILNLEWETDSRDENIVEPVLVYLEEKYSLRIIRDSIWYGCFKLLKYKPKMLLIANETGAIENVTIMMLAHRMGITTVSLISEGLNYYTEANIEAEYVKEQFYGHNKKKEKIVDLKLLWSETTLNKFYKYIDEIFDYDVRVSGATGFDRYKLLTFMDKKDFLKSVNKFYEHIILIIGYGFDNNLSIEEIKPDSKSRIEWLKKNRDKLNEIYKKLIKNNPNILFVLKCHPGDRNFARTEFVDLKQYTNVVFLHKKIGIDHLISISDLLIAFDSTTCMEAWMLDKVTIIINPYEEDFVRSSIYKGCIMTKNYGELQSRVKEYYLSGTICDFQRRENLRKEIIRENIGYSDGENYCRAGEMIKEIFDKGSLRSPRINSLLFRELIKELKEALIEYSFIGWLKIERKKYLVKRHKCYNKNKRIENSKKYRVAIQKRIRKSNI